MVNFSITADFKQVEKMFSQFGQKAIPELNKAVLKTSVYGLRELKKESPVLTGQTKNTWKYILERNLVAGIFNNVDYINYIINGRGPVVAQSGKALIFKLSRFKGVAKTVKDTRQLYAERQEASRKLKGKGLTPEQKQSEIIRRTGIVLTKRVKATRPNDFVTRTLPRITTQLEREVGYALDRMLA